MNNNTSSSLIQDWFVINDGRWAHLLGDAGSPAAA
jgi:hypothetical protein